MSEEKPSRKFKIFNSSGHVIDYMAADSMEYTPAGFALYVEKKNGFSRMVYAIPVGCGAKDCNAKTEAPVETGWVGM